jgi:hypothetical protein
MPDKLTLKYDDEFIVEVASLPAEIADALYYFLERLAADPDAPGLNAQAASRGLFSSQFTSGYCVYWKVDRAHGTLTTLTSSRPRLISARSVRPTKPSIPIQRNAMVRL